MVIVIWIGLQIKCSIQIHCFNKHSVRHELCIKKYLIAEGSSSCNLWESKARENAYSTANDRPI